MENLVAAIYHEQQEPGSMLCAQHALNSLLQGNYFSAPDLSEIARNLDELEESYDADNPGTRSGNMDDSGFFSVQVLDNALKVWDFNLARWRAEEMRSFHDHPETQLAFILNYEQHWFTLRRFGPHWFNLNSFSKPEWVSNLYLGLVIQQAEADGYSVFAVTPIDPASTPTLPHTMADDLAATIPEPQSGSRPDIRSFTSRDGSAAIEGLEDEDYELQAALQASLMGGDPDELPPLERHTVPLPTWGEPSSADPVPGPSTDADPVSATMERNRRLLERMKAEQEEAQRQLWAEGGGMRVDQERETEEEMIRRAIEESEASARLEGHGNPEDASSEETAAPPRFAQERVYDDDDAELQAALKASLEQLPEGWSLPEGAPVATTAEPMDLEPDAADAEELPAENVSVDELRRRRLARFGA
ncbi:Josephin-domain-containing protein [Roridomyces roridus]|uniref:ubiquitinyl hydrolase 1 n=1 Tax=Roridomyces roridus TaxID=1738132 RepID=A0AAD7G026_9AGAR|nr:Josephin-domain-containing protein [Roridomyces roridus]